MSIRPTGSRALPRPIPPLTLPWRRFVRPLALTALLVVGIVAANLLALHLSPAVATLDVGARADRAAVPGFHGPERDQTGTSYRWSSADAALLLRGPATNGPALVAFTLGWLPPGASVPRMLALSSDERPWLSLAIPDQPRRYTFLLPPAALTDGEVQLGFHSATTISATDERALGVRVDAASLRWPADGWALPPFGVLTAQIGLALLWLTLAHWLGLGTLVSAGVTLSMLVALVVYMVVEPGLAAPWFGRLLGAGMASAAVLWGAGRVVPLAEPTASLRFHQALLLLTLAALAFRLMGVLYPLFFSHDLLVNSGRLRNVQLGVLALFDRPSEFSRRVIVVSPTVFILALPGSLLGDRGLALQGLYALLDGTTPLLVALLARRPSSPSSQCTSPPSTGASSNRSSANG